jgi:hypothetical protein
VSRIRTIKPSFFLDEDLAKLPAFDRLVFAGLWTQADKAGRLEDRPQRLRVQLLPYDDGNFEAILQRLHDSGFIHRYVVNGVKLIQVSNFSKHQRPHHTEPDSTFPPCDTDSQPSIHGADTVEQPLTDGEAPDGREGKGMEGKGMEGRRAEHARFAPPSPAEVREFVSEKKYTFDPEAFVAFYESKGWKVGNAPMKSWKAACVTWSKRDGRDGSAVGHPPVRTPGPPSRPPGVTFAEDGSWITYRGERFDREPGFERRGIAGWYRSAPNAFGENGGFRLDGSGSMADAKWSPTQYVDFFRGHGVPGLPEKLLAACGVWPSAMKDPPEMGPTP